MRARYSFINLVIGVGGQLFNTLLAFIGRMIFIHYLSAAYLGVNGLFTDVLGMLNLAELGIGTAMIFSLYKPAAEENHEKIGQLMNLYKILYRCVAGVVLLAGLCLLPFLHIFIKGAQEIQHLRLIYMLYLMSSVSSYLLSYKNSILQANQKAYIRTAWTQIMYMIQLILQAIVLIATQNFILYLIVQLVTQFMVNVVVSIHVDRNYTYLKHAKGLPPKEELRDIVKNIGAMSMHRLGTVVVRGTDNLLMSAFIGLSTVGLYSNYRMVTNGITILMDKVSSAFAGSVGNLGATENPDKVYEIYKALDFAMFVLFAYVAGGLIALFNLFIELLFGAKYVFPFIVVLLIIFEFYISGLRRVNLLFREALGLFWRDRYKAVVEAFINLVASIILVKNFGIVGIVGGTIISSVCTCVWVEPYILMRYGFQGNWKQKLANYFGEYFVRMLFVGVVGGIGWGIVFMLPRTGFLWFIIDGLLYTGVFMVAMLLVFCRKEEFRYLYHRLRQKFQRKSA